MPRSFRFALPLLLLLMLPAAAQEWVPFGPPGGGVHVMTVDSTTGAIYMGGLRSLYRLDRGATVWTRLSDPAGTAGHNATKLMADGGELFVVIGCCTPFHSADAGMTWQPVVIDTTPTAQYPAIVELRDTLYAQAQVAPQPIRLYRSIDNGRSWSPTDTLDRAMRVSDRIATDGRELLISAGDGIYRRDSAAAWSRFTPGEKRVLRLLVAGDTMVVMLEQFAMHRSYDRGKTWEPYPVTGENSLQLRGDTLWRVNGTTVSTMPVDGSAWRVRDTLDHASPGAFFAEHDGLLMIGDYAGTQLWDAAADAFVPFDTGRSGHALLQVFEHDGALFVSTGYVLFVSDDDGLSWDRRTGPTGKGAPAIEAVGDMLFSFDDNKIYRTRDHARSWQQLPFDAATYTYPQVLHVAGTTGDTLFAVGLAALRTTNGGARWERFTIGSITGINTIVGSGDTLVAQALDQDRTLFSSIDLGATWDTLETPDSLSQVRELLYHDGTLYLGLGETGLLRSTDLGETWRRTMTFLPDNRPPDTISSIGSLGVAGDTIVVLVGHEPIGNPTYHLYHSVDRGDTWRELTTPRELLPVDVYTIGDRLLLATPAHGLRITSGTLDVERTREPAASNDVLRIAFDPANNRAYWSTPVPTSYSIDLYTITGEHLVTVERGKAEAGEQTALLPVRADGLYLLMIRTQTGNTGLVIRGE